MFVYGLRIDKEAKMLGKSTFVPMASLNTAKGYKIRLYDGREQSFTVLNAQDEVLHFCETLGEAESLTNLWRNRMNGRRTA